MSRYIWPLAGFVVLVFFLGIGLTLNPAEVPSPLIDKPAPAFALPELHEPQKTFTPESMKDRVWVLNVWASWCYACLTEHAYIQELSSQHGVPVIGLNYKDIRAEAIAWLARNGDSYEKSVSDTDGKVGIDYGVYGVPETFVIDKAGIIRYKHIGPVTRESLRDTLLPLIRKLQ